MHHEERLGINLAKITLVAGLSEHDRVAELDRVVILLPGVADAFLRD